jgi:LacI family transcriptional regulator
MKGDRKITIRDVAAMAGVSHQTVSRVLNNSVNVSPAALERVRAAVKELGYSPSIAARRMGGSKSFLLLALNDRDRTIEQWRGREGTDWVDQMLLGGMLACAKHGYRLILELVDTHNDHIARELGNALSALHPDGVILTPPHSDNQLIIEILARAGVRCARIGAYADLGGTIIRMDDRRASGELVEHLASLGHRRIGFIGGSTEYLLSGERLTGFREAVTRLGLDGDPALMRDGDFDYASGERAAAELLDLSRPPTAIIATSEAMARAAIAIATGRRLAIPDEMSLVSFDDTPTARNSVPSLTAINQPIAEMTALAAQFMMFPESDADDDAGGKLHLVEFELLPRDSSGPAPRQ